MPALKIAAAFSSQSAGQTYAKSAQGLLLEATSHETAHLPFAALFIGTTDDLRATEAVADIGLYLISERNILNDPLSDLSKDQYPQALGIFPMVASEALGAKAADDHWREKHAPLALAVHTAMTHYYQLNILHRFSGKAWDGLALCCFASEEDLRHKFYNSDAGKRSIAEDVQRFANTRQSPRRVIAEIRDL